MSRYFIVPDIHGELDIAAGLLRQEGLLNDEWERLKDDNTVIQLGDLLNCVASSVADDNRCLDHSHWFDILLIGNHEHPYFGGPAFAGFWKDPTLTHRLRSLDSRERYKIAWDCDGVLVSHAGLVTHLHDTYDFNGDSSNVARVLNNIWSNPDHKASHELFSAIGWERGGFGKWGGVLWADWTQYKTPKLKQIVGHSVGDSIRLQMAGRQEKITRQQFNLMNINYAWESVCIDLGAGKHSDTIIGAWIEDGNVRLVEYMEEK